MKTELFGGFFFFFWSYLPFLCVCESKQDTEEKPVENLTPACRCVTRSQRTSVSEVNSQ